MILVWLRLALSVAVASSIFAWLGTPTPTMFGGMAGALLVALRIPSPRPSVPRSTYLAAQGIVGCGVAAQLEPAAVGAFAADWDAIVLVTVGSLVISVAIGQLLRWHGVSAITATFSSIAGGASGMSAVADDLGADDRVVTVIQYLRVLLILLTLPLVMSLAFSVEATSPGPLHAASLADYVFVSLALAGGLTFAKLVRMPSPGVLGPMFAGALLSLAPFFADVAIPGGLQTASFLVIGMQVGLKFTRDSLRSIARMLPTAVVCIVLIIAACAGLGVLLAAMTGESYLDAYLATTPGGLPAVLATSTATSGNVTFISAVQLLRLVSVLILAPVVARLVDPRRR